MLRRAAFSRRFFSQQHQPWVDPSAIPKGESLAKYSRDLSALAKERKLDPVIGRGDEIRRIITVLSRKTKSNPLLLGDPGVGKSILMEGLAQRIADGDVPASMLNKRVLSLDLPAIMAGTGARGQFEERIKAILKDIEEDPSAIIFIDEMHLLVGMGQAGGAMDASNILKPALARGSLHCVGATTNSEYRQYVEPDAALARRFQPVAIDEPDVASSIGILRGLKPTYELHHGVQIRDSAVVAAVTLSDRYITDRHLPDKAIDLLDEASSQLRLQQESRPERIEKLARKLVLMRIEERALRKEEDPDAKQRYKELKAEIEAKEREHKELEERWKREKDKLGGVKTLQKQIDAAEREYEEAQRSGNLAKASEILYGTLPKLREQLPADGEELPNETPEEEQLLSDAVTEQQIARVVSNKTGIPAEKILGSEAAKLLHLEEELRARVVGQERAVKAIADTIRIARAGLQSHDRPLGVFAFLGPTGVGKTELAKTLSALLFDSEKNMTRIDMAEFSESFSTSRLIGSPPGYVGFDQGGELTEAVRRKPFSVVLLDECEKAHPQVLSLLLSMLDEGHMTDSRGVKVDFRNTVIIMTSNLGSEILAQLPDETPAETVRDAVMERVRQRMTPEFINRLDEVVLFNKLGREQQRKILDIQLNKVDELLKDSFKAKIALSDDAKTFLADKGYDPSMGARPLKRAIHDHLLAPLSTYLLEHALESKGASIEGIVAGDKISFRAV